MHQSNFFHHLLGHVCANFKVPENVVAEKGSAAIYLEKRNTITEQELKNFYENYKQIFNAWEAFYNGYSTTYELLSDETSRVNYVASICARMFWHIRKMPVIKKYVISPPLEKTSAGHYNLESLGFVIQLDIGLGPICLDFCLEQYRYNIGEIDIAAVPDDIVLDGGAYIGDTALYFASRVGPAGKVFSFEFSPNNIARFEHNMALNPELAHRITLVQRPLWSTSNTPISFSNDGPASTVSDTGTAYKTICIDDFVHEHHLTHLDFIKLDIEGAEVEAIRGAAKTIARFRPKLAICLYHAKEHYYQIPLLIKQIHPAYDCYVRHMTAGLAETVLYCIDRGKTRKRPMGC